MRTATSAFRQIRLFARGVIDSDGSVMVHGVCRLRAVGCGACRVVRWTVLVTRVSPRGSSAMAVSGSAGRGSRWGRAARLRGLVSLFWGGAGGESIALG